MKTPFSFLSLAIALILSAAVGAGAQSRDKFVISAQAGGVNAIAGRAEVKSMAGAEWELLNVTDDLITGDRVRTGSDGRIEMLLNPGSYLRVSENSEFELVDNSLENLEVRLVRGVAIIEATGADQTELAINITTPHAKMVIVRRGLYRVNVIPGDATELFVRKGRVLLANSHTKINEGNKVTFSSTTFSIAKLEKSDKLKDGFEDWSKERAETVAQANRKIPVRDLNAYLSGFDNFYFANAFSASSSGFWLFNPRYRCFTFLPFSFGWGSPYGSSYLSVLNCFGCYGWGNRYYNGPGSVVSSTAGSRRTGSGSGSGAGSGSGSSGGGPRVSPSSPKSDFPRRGTERTESPVRTASPVRSENSVKPARP